MNEHENQIFHIDANRIPFVMSDEYRSQYVKEANLIRLQTSISSGDVFQYAFSKLGPGLSGHNAPHIKRGLLTLQSLLPNELQTASQIVEYNDVRGLDKLPFVCLYFDSSKVSQLLTFFEAYSKQNADSESESEGAWLVKKFISELKGLLEKECGFSEVNRAMITQVQRLKGKIWTIVKDELKESDTTARDDLSRTKIHEIIHYVSLMNKDVGNIGRIFELGYKIVNSIEIDYSYKSDEEKNVDFDQQLILIDRLTKIGRLLNGLSEAESIIHEIFGSTVLEKTDKYSHFILCQRLAIVLKLFQEVGVDEDTLKIDLVARVEMVQDDDDNGVSFLPHATGILFILSAHDLNCKQFAQTLEFSTQVDFKKGILQKIEFLVDHPDEAAEFLLNVYDDIQELMKSLVVQFNIEFVDLFKKYPDLKENLNKRELIDLKKYKKFLRNYKKMLIEKPIYLKPRVQI